MLNKIAKKSLMKGLISPYLLVTLSWRANIYGLQSLDDGEGHTLPIGS